MKYSIVVPLKNEEGNVEPLLDEIEATMQSLDATWEVIFIDDGSQDQTLEKLKSLKPAKSFLKILSFTQNFGQSSAFEAGFCEANGEWVITLDGDRQNDPADIPKLISLANKGYDLVTGVRTKRKDTLIKRLTSKLANSVRNKFLQDGIRDTGCSLKIYRASCLKKIKMFHGMHRFLPALFQIEGFKVAQVEVNHRERVRGVTNYSFANRSLSTIADLLAVSWMRKRKRRWQIKEKVS